MTKHKYDGILPCCWILLVVACFSSSCTQPGIENKQAAQVEAPVKDDIEEKDDPVPGEKDESTPEPAEVAKTTGPADPSPEPPEPVKAEDEAAKKDTEDNKEEKSDPEPKKIQEEPWKTAQKKRTVLRAEVQKSRNKLMADMRKSLQDKQKLLNEARKVRQRVNKARKDKGPEFEELNKKMKDLDSRIKEEEKTRKRFQDQLKDLYKRQNDEFKRINDWSQKETRLYEKQLAKERQRKQKEELQPAPELKAGPMKEGKSRSANVRVTNPAANVITLYGFNETDGHWTQPFILGKEAALLINGEPTSLDKVAPDAKVTFWVHPDDNSTITWLEVGTK